MRNDFFRFSLLFPLCLISIFKLHDVFMFSLCGIALLTFFSCSVCVSVLERESEKVMILIIVNNLQTTFDA